MISELPIDGTLLLLFRSRGEKVSSGFFVVGTSDIEEFALSSIRLIELQLAGRIRSALGPKPHMCCVRVLDASPTGDRTSDEVLGHVAQVGSLEARPMSDWAPGPMVRREVADEMLSWLVGHGTVRREERRLPFGGFLRPQYKVVDPASVPLMRTRVFETLLGANTINGRDAALIAALQATGVWQGGLRGLWHRTDQSQRVGKDQLATAVNRAAEVAGANPLASALEVYLKLLAKRWARDKAFEFGADQSEPL